MKLGTDNKYWEVSNTHVDVSSPVPPPHPVTIEALPQGITLDLKRTAIIVVDMQNDFCSTGGWLDHVGVDCTPTRSPVKPLNQLLPTLRQLGVPVIWLNWGNRPDRLNLSPALLHVYNMTGEGKGIGDPLPGNGSRVLEKGSWGASMIDELIVDPKDVHIDKYRMSGFWDTPLDSILRNLAVNSVFFGGVNLDQCVMATLQDAACLGYDCILLEDCCATTSPSFCTEATLYNVKQCYGFVAQSSQVLRSIENRK